MQEFFIFFLFPELYLFNEIANACLKLLLGTPTQISVRLSYLVPHKTPATSPRKVATLTLQSHSSRDSSECSGSTMVSLHNELPKVTALFQAMAAIVSLAQCTQRCCGPRSLLSRE